MINVKSSQKFNVVTVDKNHIINKVVDSNANFKVFVRKVASDFASINHERQVKVIAPKQSDSLSLKVQPLMKLLINKTSNFSSSVLSINRTKPMVKLANLVSVTQFEDQFTQWVVRHAQDSLDSVFTVKVWKFKLSSAKGNQPTNTVGNTFTIFDLIAPDGNRFSVNELNMHRNRISWHN